MEKFLEAAAIGWNPISEVRRRMGAGTLSVRSVLVPCIGIVIACNLFAAGAQQFFSESLHYELGGQMPDHPLMTSDYVKRLLSGLGALVPIAAVSLLPMRVFHPPGRSATVAAIVILAGAWAFYGAAIGVPVHFVAGTLVAANPGLDVSTYSLLFILVNILIGITVAGLMLFFWFRTMLSVLKLSGTKVICIGLVVVIAEALLGTFFAFVALSVFSGRS